MKMLQTLRLPPRRAWILVFCAFMLILALPLAAGVSEEYTSEDEHFEGLFMPSLVPLPPEEGGEMVKVSFFDWNNDKDPLYEAYVPMGGFAVYEGTAALEWEDFVFVGWTPDPETTELYEDTRFTAQYNPAEEMKYQVTVYYVYQDGSIAASPYTAYLSLGETLQKPSPGITNYTPDKPTVVVSIDGYTERVSSVIVIYAPTAAPGPSYVVNYVDDHSNALLPQKITNSIPGLYVIEQAPPISGYVPTFLFQMLQLGEDSDQNVITFVYIPNEAASYRVEYYYTDHTSGTYGDGPDEWETIDGPVDMLVTAAQRPRPGYVLDAAHSTVSGYITAGGSPLVLRLFYQRQAIGWTINHLHHELNTEVAPPETGTMLLGDTLTAVAMDIAGYDYFARDPDGMGIVIGEDPDENVITLFYKPFDITPIVITSSSATVEYDGAEHAVSGFTYTVDGKPAPHLTITGLKADGATGTDVGTYTNAFAYGGPLTIWGGGVDVTKYYDPVLQEGALTITSKTEAVSASFTWPGMPAAAMGFSLMGAELVEASFFNWDDDITPLYVTQVERDGYAVYEGDTPERADYIFIGWSPDPATTQMTEDTRFTAQFSQLGAQDYQVTIYYVYEDGALAATPYKASFSLGEAYQVNSPVIADFTPDMPIVAGVIDGSSGFEQMIIVTYTPAVPPIVPGPLYTIKHYLQKLKTPLTPGNEMDISKYDLKETQQNIQSLTGNSVTVVPKVFPGFTPLAGQNLTFTLAPNNSTVINVFYTRDVVPIYFRSNGGSYVPTLYKEVGSGLQWFEVPDPTRTGFTFAGWSKSFTYPYTVPAGGDEIFAKWNGNMVTITIYHKIQMADGGGYEHYMVENKPHYAGSIVNLTSSSFLSITDYTYERHDTNVLVNGDGKPTPINVYYKRNPVTYNFYTTSPKTLVYSITAPWGTSIIDKWNELNQLYPNRTWTWQPDGTGTPKHLVERMDRFNRDFYSANPTGDVYTIHYHTQKLDAGGNPINEFDHYSTITFQSPTTAQAVASKHYTDLVGYTKDMSTGWTYSGGEYVRNFGANRTLDLYYYRAKFYVTFNNPSLADEKRNFYYGADISSCNAPPAKRPPEVPSDWVFIWWANNQTVRYAQPIDFTGMTMPAHNNLFASAFWEKPGFNARFYAHKADGAEYLYNTFWVEKGKFAPEAAPPSRSGYTFTHWSQRGASTPFPFTTKQITANIDLVAQWVPKTNLKYTVNYFIVGPEWKPGDLIPQPMVPVYPTKTVNNQAAGAAITEKAPDVQGYTPVQATLSRTLTGDPALDVLNFAYKQNVSLPTLSYVVNYVDEQSNVLLPQKVKTNVTDAFVTEYAPAISGYTPKHLFQTLQLSANNAANVITFVYTQNVLAAYTVEHYYTNLATGQYDGTPDVKENLFGAAGAMVTAVPQPKAGYSVDAGSSTSLGYVDASGSLVLRLYYQRQAIGWTVSHYVSGTNTEVAPSDTGAMLLGETLTAVDKDLTDYDFDFSVPPGKQIVIGHDPAQNVIALYYSPKQTSSTGMWTVRYYRDYFGGELFYSEQVESGSPANGPASDPTDHDQSLNRPFIGWYKSGISQPVDLRTMLVKSDLDLVAKYNSSSGVVRFRDFYGDIIATYIPVYEVGEAYALRPTTVQAKVPAGRTIQYWYREGGPSTDYFAQPHANPVTGLVTLLPKVSGIYTVSFDSQGGSPVSPLSGEEGQPTPVPANNPTRNGYTFMHWSLTANGTAFNFSTPLVGDLTLFAVWGNPKMVEYRLVYHTSDYAEYKQPDDRIQWTQRTYVTVKPEDYKPVDTVLTAAEISALAAKYKAQATTQSDFFKYYTYYENTGKSIPLQTEPLNAEGTTSILVYYTPILFDVIFDLSQNANMKITYEGKDYKGATYRMPANYMMTITNSWPFNAGEKMGSAVFSYPGNVVVGWKVQSTGAQIGSVFQIPFQLVPLDGSKTVTVTPVLAATANAILLNHYEYRESNYIQRQDILAGPSSAYKLSTSLVFSDGSSKHVYLKSDAGHPNTTVFYTVYPSYSYSSYVLRTSINTSNTAYRWVMNGSTLANSPEINRYEFIAAPFRNLTYNAGKGALPAGVPATYRLKQTYPIIGNPGETGVHTPPTPIAPNGYVFVGWCRDALLTDLITANTMKDNNDQVLYAKYASNSVTVTFYDVNTKVGKATLNYGQSFGQAGETFPAEYTVGQSVPGKGEFTGWFYRLGTEWAAFTLNMPLYGDYSVYAQYEAEEYTVTFYDDLGNLHDTRTVWSDPTGSWKNTIALGGGLNRTLPTMPSKPGHEFAWYTQPQGKGAKFTVASLVNGNMNVYAYYQRNEYAWTVHHLSNAGDPLAPPDTGTMLFGETLTAVKQSFDGYVYASSDPPSGEITIGSDPGMNVITLHYKEILYTLSVPTSIDFGTLPISMSTRLISPVDIQGTIQITDGRDSGEWELHAKATPFTSGAEMLEGGLVFKDPGSGMIQLMFQSVLIARKPAGAQPGDTTTVTWENGTGVLLLLDPDAGVEGDSYSGTIIWTLVVTEDW